MGNDYRRGQLHLFLISALTLMLLAGGLYLFVYPQATAALDGLHREQSKNQELNYALDALNSRYEELQGKYDGLLQEKKELEDRLKGGEAPDGAAGRPTAYLTIDDGPDKYAPQILQILKESAETIPGTNISTGISWSRATAWATIP